jgi:hypothetical protein
MLRIKVFLVFIFSSLAIIPRPFTRFCAAIPGCDRFADVPCPPPRFSPHHRIVEAERCWGGTKGRGKEGHIGRKLPSLDNQRISRRSHRVTNGAFCPILSLRPKIWAAHSIYRRQSHQLLISRPIISTGSMSSAIAMI